MFSFHLALYFGFCFGEFFFSTSCNRAKGETLHLLGVALRQHVFAMRTEGKTGYKCTITDPIPIVYLSQVIVRLYHYLQANN